MTTSKTLALFVMVAVALAAQTTPPANNFLVHNFVSDLPGIADHQDPNLINPWGNGFSTSPFWIGNNGSGTSTIYDGAGTPSSLVVDIPSASGALTGGPVTGVIQNSFSSNTAAFALASGKPASFLFCAEDGVISGWNSGVDSTHAHILFNNSASGAVYKACALGGTSTAPLLFAANFNSGNVDVFDLNLNPVVNAKAFVDASIPSGFAPFNVANIGGTIYVTYAKQDAMKHDDVAGPGNGYLALYDQSGNLQATLISQGALNSPWGLAIAPSTFAPFGGALLVGNFGDGKINAFNPLTGAQLGTLDDLKGNPISLQGLWSINFGGAAKNADPGTLYFTAGPGGGPNNDPVESHGLFGSIQAAPVFTTATVESAASYLPGPLAPNTWMMIKGSALSATTGSWQISGTTLPTAVNGVTVTVNGEAAPVNYVSNTQVNFLVPADIQPGTTQVQLANNGLSAGVQATVDMVAPAFFTVGSANGTDYVLATHANGSEIGPTTLISGKTTPASPGETIVLYGTGFGQTTTPIPNGQVISTAIPLPAMPTVVIDGIVATVSSATLAGTGTYQLTVEVPQGAHSGDDLVVALLGNGETQANAFITIAAQ